MKSATSTERAAMFLEAARRLAEREQTPDTECFCSCCAIEFVGGAREKNRYSALFNPLNGNTFWGLNWPRPSQCRVLALCFMAAMVEAGDA